MASLVLSVSRDQIGKTFLWVSTVVALIIGTTGVAGAASSTAGDATPNFTESGSCGTYGVRGQYSPTTRLASRIYGPFADFFGRDYEQVSNSIVTWFEPSGRSFRVHSRSYPAFQQARQNIVDSGAGYNVWSGAAWNWRNVDATRRMSHHAMGNAIDINPSQNPYTSGTLITNMPASYRNAWKAAGFCWGGDWQFTKDPMHYTWRGPAARAGLQPRLAPYPALTSRAGFTTRALSVAAATSNSAQYFAMADRRRDGADDLYALVDQDGTWQVQIAGALSHFATLGVRQDSAMPTGGIPILADANGDGHGDLWRFDASGSVFSADVYFESSGYGRIGLSVTTGAATSGDAELGLALFDWSDWIPDLFVIRRDTGIVEVYSSASGYKSKVHTSQLPVAIGDAKIVLADRDVDGNTDIWLVRPGSGAAMQVAQYSSSSGYAAVSESLNTGMSVAPGSSVLPGDWDGDGRSDLYVVTGREVSVWLGGVPDRPVSELWGWFSPDEPNTFDAGPICASVCDTIGYTNPGGVWRLAHENAWITRASSFYYGNPGDEPFMGDWDCDGVDTPGLYRRSDGYVYLRNSNTQGVADIRFFFGNPGDIPIPGDFDGDGCDTVSLYRPSEQNFYVINRLGSGETGLGAADYSFMFGDPGDKPFVGDFDGNGVDETGLHRETTGRVYFRLSLTTGVADYDFIFGNPGDLIVAGDWDGNGNDTPAIFRPSDGNWYLRLSNTQGVADHVLPFGVADRGFLPVAGKTGISIGLSSLSEDETGPAEFEPLQSG